MNPARYNEVIYNEAMELATELYDFKTCTYPGGNSYGISEEKKCRKAPEGVAEEKEAVIKKTLAELKGYKPGYQKVAGDNLQDPVQAGKYAEFYEKNKDLSYKAPKNTDPAVVKEVLQRLKDEDPAQYTSVMKALNSKGSPEAGIASEASRSRASSCALNNSTVS